ncbi:hypothetical protein M407DRAFT_23362 [Tulasnella calospora MUT 4182]|uniref:Uncharacterized protein n=1 Tax=Tulasnella calospora MUT 4182 TaxID=1051891 RepID=A0A0C3QJT4_9AGAM|nr:hypothetical protein M407DRAFT_23362 [Tulasnella calospora MUT 4182]
MQMRADQGSVICEKAQNRFAPPDAQIDSAPRANVTTFVTALFDFYIVWDLITRVGCPDNRVVLLGKEKDKNTSGDTKVKVQQRIASELFPDEFEDPTSSTGEKKKRQKALGTRVKGKWEQQQVRKMMVTGNGVNLNVDDANLGEIVLAGAGGLFVGAEGPDEATSCDDLITSRHHNGQQSHHVTPPCPRA